ncbi:MAG TPA: fumarylacetoacetate hydrolase family protein [Gammaproteobacteria bacterium]
MAIVKLESRTFDVQRIFCIGRNYAAHAAELGSELGGDPVLFMKPATAIVPAGGKIRLPQQRGALHHEAELVLLIGRDNATDVKDIAGVALGLDLTLRDEQAKLKSKGLPWELAKAFDDSAPLGDFVAAPEDFAALAFDCHVNGGRRQHGETRNMLFPVPRIIDFLSRHFTLRAGDLVYTGTPEGVGPLAPGDVIEVRSAFTGTHSWHCE